MKYLLCAVVLPLLLSVASASAKEPAIVDATTMHHKVMCGYQGWFRTPDDGFREGFKHWSRGEMRPDKLTVEMWPDMSEYTQKEIATAGTLTHGDGSPAKVFSSTHSKTVERHFQWMQEYGIDGAFLQRFLIEADRRSTAQVLANVREAAQRSGRTYAICYDLSGHKREGMIEKLAADWKRLIDEDKITADKHYLHHRGKPVVFVWGFFSDRFSGDHANALIDIFKQDDRYAATLVGGCQWYWRTEKDEDWAKAFARFDVISPWNVGNVTLIDGQKQAQTDYWKDDLAFAKQNGIDYLPVIYPGFGWTNLKGPSAARDTIPRLRGGFYWRQFNTARELGVEMAYVAMFDEVDEATAIFKVTNNPPTQAKFQTNEGLPSDWYLRLTGEGAKLLRGERKPTATIPIRP